MVGDGDFRFPPAMRLKKKTEFVRVFREGTVWKGESFSLHILPRERDAVPKSGGALVLKPSPRLGMVVTRKVGSAVERNRIKRKIREAFRKAANHFPAVDLVIRPNAACKEATEEDISRSLKKAVAVTLENVKERK